MIHQFIVPFLHFLALPAGNRAFVDRLGLIGNDQILINAHHNTHTLAFRASTDRVVEIEQVFAGLHEVDTIRLKALGEHFFFLIDPYPAFALSLKERRLHAVCKTVAGRRLFIDHNAVHQQVCLFAGYLLIRVLVQTDCVAFRHHTAETLALPQSQLLLQTAAFRQDDRTQQIQPCTLRLLFHVPHYVADRVLLHFLSAHGRVRVPYARVQ